jgi:hypothetical protein
VRYHPGATDFNFFHFWWRTLTIGPWPSGSAWFFWVLLAPDAIAALLWTTAPRVIEALGQLIYALRDRPMTAFVAFLIFSIMIYLPMHLIFGDSSWLEPGHYPLVIQTSRILLYAGYFFYRRRCRCGRLERRGACREWGARKAPDSVARLCDCLLWRNSADGLYPPKWAHGLQFTAALVAHGLWSRLRDVQRGDDVRGPRGFPAL